MNARVPPGKRVLNTHISVAEHTFLKSEARANSMTVTMLLRNLIRREMRRATYPDRRSRIANAANAAGLCTDVTHLDCSGAKPCRTKPLDSAAKQIQSDLIPE